MTRLGNFFFTNLVCSRFLYCFTYGRRRKIDCLCCPHWIEGPKLLAMFCNACNRDAESTDCVKDVAGSTDGLKGAPALQGRFGCILEGLAGCVGYRGNGMQVFFFFF